MKTPHELVKYLESVGADLAREYARIRSRSREDPGTAGDEAEGNWAEVFRGWLPPQYPVATKGRIIFLDGSASPQVDLLILRPSYPRKLIDKKAYLAGGVVAAFECKLTLRKRDLDKAYKTCVAIKSKLDPKAQTIFDELNRPIFFGVLAHAHAIRAANKDTHDVILDALEESQARHCPHPSSLLDLLAIASDAAFVMQKSVELPPDLDPELHEFFDEIGLHKGGIVTCFTSHYSHNPDREPPAAAVLGTVIFTLLARLAYEDASLREYAEYFRSTGTPLGAIGRLDCAWEPTCLSHRVLRTIKANGFEPGPWSPWSKHL